MAKKEKTVSNKEVKKVNKKKERKKVEKDGYFKLVKKEMKMVKWPTFKEVLKYTVSTIVFCVILCGIFMFLDLIMSIVKGWFV